MTHPRTRPPILTGLRSKQYGPDWAAVLPAAMLCVTVSVIHVLDQGGVATYAGPPWWLGWGYRLVEAGAQADHVARPPKPVRSQRLSRFDAAEPVLGHDGMDGSR